MNGQEGPPHKGITTLVSPPLDWMFLVLVGGVVGLCCGSFLTVVVTRGPALWGLVDHTEASKPPGLAHPPSHCPYCQSQLTARQLIPLLSYAIQRGRCAHCGAPISAFYPLVEALGLGAGVLAVVLPGGWLAMIGAFVLFLFLIALGAIDWRTGYLPDALTFPLILLGLGFGAAGVFQPWQMALLGAALGYGVFWAIGATYRAFRGVDGLGLGDAKLLAAGGAFAGPYALPFIVLIAAFSALSYIGLANLRGAGLSAQSEIRFGPFLAVGVAGAFIAQRFVAS